MCYLLLRLFRFLFRFLLPDEEEIINLLNKKRLDRDFSVQTIKKHTADCVVYDLHKVEGQQLARLDFRNHVAENIGKGKQLLPSHHMASDSRNHVAEKIGKNFQEVEYQLPSHYFIFDIRNHVAENTLPKEESQLLASHNLALHYRNHVAENTFPMVESLRLPSHYLISYFRDQVAEQTFSGEETLVFAQFDALYSYNGFQLQSLEQRSSS